MYGYWLDDYETDDFHLIHTETCLRLPALERRTPLGLHTNCESALEYGKLHYDEVAGCPYCTSDCHSKPD